MTHELFLYLVVTVFTIGASYGSLRWRFSSFGRRIASLETLVGDLRDHVLIITEFCPHCSDKKVPSPTPDSNGDPELPP